MRFCKIIFLLLFLLPSISFADEAWVCNVGTEGDRLYTVDGNQIIVHLTTYNYPLDIVKQTDDFIFAERNIGGDKLFSHLFKKQKGVVYFQYIRSSEVKELFKDKHIDLRIRNTEKSKIFYGCVG